MDNLGKIAHFLEPTAEGKHALHLKFSKIIHACESSENLIVVIYLVEQRTFLYFNNAFKKIAGKNLQKLLDQGWDYWFEQIAPEESFSIKNTINVFLSDAIKHDTLILKYNYTNCTGEKVCIKHEIAIHKLEEYTLAVNYFYDVSDKEIIEQCLLNNNSVNGSVYSNPYCSTGISPREKQVLKLVADGFSSKQIADQLFISNHTAISHRKHLIEKFKVKNTAQLIKKASKMMEL